MQPAEFAEVQEDDYDLPADFVQPEYTDAGNGQSPLLRDASAPFARPPAAATPRAAGLQLHRQPEQPFSRRLHPRGGACEAVSSRQLDAPLSRFASS